MVSVTASLRHGIKTPGQLYKYLMRSCEKLPQDAQAFYKHSVRQSFRQHEFEPDPERVQQIIEKSIADADWILKKYTSNKKQQ